MDIERDLGGGVDDEMVSGLGSDPGLGVDDAQMFETLHESHVEDEERPGD